MSEKTKVLFLCTGNSCRSQMAEGLCTSFNGDVIQSYSAGIVKHGLNPFAVKAMLEIGIDISGHFSKTVDEMEEKDTSVKQLTKWKRKTLTMWLQSATMPMRPAHSSLQEPDLSTEGLMTHPGLPGMQRRRKKLWNTTEE